eukprot:3010124-Prymnesium_polylepis.1
MSSASRGLQIAFLTKGATCPLRQAATGTARARPRRVTLELFNSLLYAALSAYLVYIPDGKTHAAVRLLLGELAAAPRSRAIA